MNTVSVAGKPNEYSRSQYRATQSMPLVTVVCFTVLICLGCQIPRSDPAPESYQEPDTVTVQHQIQSELSKMIGSPVLLDIDFRKSHDSWTFISGVPTQLDGKPIDILQTPFALDYEEGYFENRFLALIETPDSELSNEKLVHFSYGATDSPFVSWSEELNLPMCLFIRTEKCTNQ